MTERFLVCVFVLQLDSLLLGYQHSTCVELFDFLLEFVNKTERAIFMGDLNGEIKCLYQLLEHTYKFKSKRNEPENFTIPLKVKWPTVISSMVQ